MRGSSAIGLWQWNSNVDIMRNALFGVLATMMVCTVCQGKQFTRCQLTYELMRNNFSKTFLSNWVCLIEQESNRNTSAYTEKSNRRKFYGLFQIPSEWCKEGKKGGKCNIACEALLDDDIRDDCACAQNIFVKQGFKYWSQWEKRCKNSKNLPDIEKCPDYGSGPRASPPRLRRSQDLSSDLETLSRDQEFRDRVPESEFTFQDQEQ